MIKILSVLVVCAAFGFILGTNGTKFNNIQETGYLSTIKYYTKQQRNLTLNVKIHMDETLRLKFSKKYGKASKLKMKRLPKNLLANLEAIFKDLSEDTYIKFNLLNKKFKIKTTERNNDASLYLRRYCDWQSGRKAKKWFYSVLLTNLDLYYINKQKQKVFNCIGRSYNNGLCSPNLSCSVVEWHQNATSYYLAHELAHSMGISHDGEPHNICRSPGYIMDAKAKRNDRTKSRKTWSSCSKLSLKKFLRKKKAWCLQ